MPRPINLFTVIQEMTHREVQAAFRALLTAPRTPRRTPAVSNARSLGQRRRWKRRRPEEINATPTTKKHTQLAVVKRRVLGKTGS